MTSPNLFDHVLIALVCVVMPLFALLRGQPEMKQTHWDTATKLGMYWTNSAFLWLVTAAIITVWLLADRSLDTLGLGPFTTTGLVTALALSAVLLLLYSVETLRQLASEDRVTEARKKWKRDTPFMPQTSREFRHYTLLALSAGVCEEVIFRGYAISYFLHFSGDSLLGLSIAVALPATIFAVSHLYQGWTAVLQIAVGSVFWGVMFIVTGSLWIPIALHFILDLVGGMVVMRVQDPPDLVELEPAAGE